MLRCDRIDFTEESGFQGATHFLLFGKLVLGTRCTSDSRHDPDVSAHFRVASPWRRIQELGLAHSQGLLINGSAPGQLLRS